MSDKFYNPFISKAFLDAWSNFNRSIYSDKTQTSRPDVTGDWLRLMDIWNQSAGSMLPDDIQQVCSNLMQQVPIYNFIGDQFSAFMKHYNGIDKTSKGWQQQMDSYFSKLQSSFVDQDITGIFHKILALPMDNIQRTLSSASVMPGDVLQGLKNDVLRTATEKYLSVPGIGYTRGSQEQYLKGIRLWTDYQKALHDFNHACSRVGLQAMEKLREKIIQLGEADKSITSLRQMYDLWVDANEHACAEFFQSDEYTSLYGKLVNSLMRYKQHNQRIVHEVLAAMNIPTQKDINTVQERQQDLRRGLLSVRRQMNEDNEAITTLARQFELLQKEVKELNLAVRAGISENKGDPSSIGKTAQKKDVPAKSAITQSKKKVVKKAGAKKMAIKKGATSELAKKTTKKRSTAKRAANRISES